VSWRNGVFAQIQAMTGPQGLGSVEGLCAAAKVSRASYYRGWACEDPDLEEMALRDAVQRLALAHRHYGYRRIGALLRREGWWVNAKRVLRMTREDNLLCLRRKAYVPATTNSNHGWRVYPNLARRMIPMAPDRLWVADITYIRLERAFVYLAVVLDACSRKVVGWALDGHLAASLALAALDMALATRRPPPGQLVHHSDRGVQYACGDYARRLEEAGLLPSMSRGGCPYDNAKAESFMKTLKQEEVDGSAYRDLADARARVGQFIDEVYNKTRLHSALDYRSPMEFEDQRPWTAIPPPTASTTATAVP
jgi:putative transposase